VAHDAIQDAVAQGFELGLLKDESIGAHGEQNVIDTSRDGVFD